MVPYMVGKLDSDSSHLTRMLVKYVPGSGYFRAFPSQNGDKFVSSPPPQSLNGSFVLFHYLLWKAKLDLTALSEGLDSWSINVSFSTGSIASCGVMKTPSCIIRGYLHVDTSCQGSMG